MRFPRQANLYEQAGILIPGATLVALLALLWPEARAQIVHTSISIGAFGVVLVVGYASGQLVAALGNMVDIVYWKLWGGLPSTWIVGPHPKLLSSAQLRKLDEMVRNELSIICAPTSEQTPKDWFPISRQIYSYVEAHRRPARLEAFNGSYGMNRGLCASSWCYAIVAYSASSENATYSICAAFAGAIYLYRMHRFGVHYARELYVQFLTPAPAKSDKRKRPSAVGQLATAE
ncbi:hypothetical protein CV770_03915 [Bradyrhizobium sp. AC87j1]|uniref:hypothetical protein n=1 Tax=Bradyrhizobium sp. AC87j1 TaxID=2055894 RepID=UPI000CEC138E|nr:hypothetical protein [Bradyrhizobium sp. AC87j1]PPQ20531.1 hypothetical protein CV770_03915 [Bradyrhizobium sp. AC87j1]